MRASESGLAAWAVDLGLPRRAWSASRGLRMASPHDSRRYADYPFMGIFWSMLIFMLHHVDLDRDHVFSDIFRRHDIGGFAKAMWIIFIIFLPLLGALAT